MIPQPKNQEHQKTMSDNLAATIRSALTPDAQSKAAYFGRVTQTEHVTITADDGTSFEKEVNFPISWESISKILSLIEKRVGI